MKSAFRNWSDVPIFLAVVREGSTLAASRKLGIAQPTVARRIDALEHALGLTLFERDTRGFRPTPEAQGLVPLAQAMETAASELTDAASNLTGPGPIRITAFQSNFSPKVTAIFSEFSESHPDTHFEFLPAVQVFDLLAGEADVALRLTRVDPDPSLIRRKISTAQFSLYGSKIYAEKYGLPKSPEFMDGHRFVTFWREDVTTYLHDWLLRHVSKDQVVMKCHEAEVQFAAIRSGRGLGLMNVRYASGDDALIQCFDPPDELSSEHLMLVSPQAYRRPEVREFTRFFAPRYAAIFK